MDADGAHTTAAEAAQRAHVDVRVARIGQLTDVLRVQHEAFRRVAAAFDIPLDVLPPTREDLAGLERLHGAGVRFLVAVADGRVVGTVRGHVRADGVVEIGRLAVGDGFLRRGVGTALVLALEEAFPDATRFELFTGEQAREPLDLYAKLGYEAFRVDAQSGVRLVWLAKER